MTLPQLSYSHSDARLEDKAKFIEGVMGRKATVKLLEFPEMTVQVVGNTAIVRHLWVSQTELEGKVTDTRIAVIQDYPPSNAVHRRVTDPTPSGIFVDTKCDARRTEANQYVASVCREQA